MSRYQTLAAPKRPNADGPFARRQKIQTALHTGLFAVAFLFVTAVVCGIFP